MAGKSSKLRFFITSKSAKAKEKVIVINNQNTIPTAKSFGDNN